LIAQQQIPLLRYATRILHDPERARDVVQDTFVKLLAEPREAIDGLASAPDIFARQAFTALYEIVPALSPGASSLEVTPATLLTLRLYYDDPTGGPRRTLEYSVADRRRGEEGVSTDFRMATAAAEFALALRDPRSPGRSAALQAVRDRAAGAATDPANDPDGRRAGFVELVKQAQTLLE